MRNTLLASSAILLALSAPAFAQSDASTSAEQTQTSAAGASQPTVVSLTDWDYDNLYSNGWSIEKLIDEARVFGVEGEEIGDIENVLVSADGQILAIIAEVGGFLDIGDTHVSVPWDQVEFSPALDYIKVPVNDENVEEYSVFGEWGYITKPETQTTQVVNDDLLTGPRVWKATELLDDYALLTGSLSYGYVDDLIFTRGGALQAVIIDSDLAYAGGARAFPYYGYGFGWTPASPYYNLPYSADEIAVIDTFDYDRMADGMASNDAASETMPAVGGSEEPASTGSTTTTGSAAPEGSDAQAN
jgi:hypothetical protein